MRRTAIPTTAAFDAYVEGAAQLLLASEVNRTLGLDTSYNELLIIGVGIVLFLDFSHNIDCCGIA